MRGYLPLAIGLLVAFGFHTQARGECACDPLRSLSGDRDDVVIQGAGMGGAGTAHGIFVNESDITVADLTIRDIPNHALFISPIHEPEDLLFHNVRCVDAGEQIFKANRSRSRSTIPRGASCVSLRRAVGARDAAPSAGTAAMRRAHRFPPGATSRLCKSATGEPRAG